MSDASQYKAFRLVDDLADPEAGFDYGVQIALHDGSTFKVGQALEEGDGVIVTSDVSKIDSLRAWGAVEATDLPDDFTPPADPVDKGASLADLKERATELDIDGRSGMNKAELTQAIADAEAQAQASEDSGSGGAPDDDNGSGD